MILVSTLISDLIKREGGYVNRSSDKGGPTKYGITLLTLQKYRKSQGLIAMDVLRLTVDEAKMIYYDIFYISTRCNLLPDKIQPIIFDMNVNHGPDDSSRILQESLNILNPTYQLKEDGVLGKITISKCTEYCSGEGNSSKLINAIVDKRNEFYRGIMLRDPTQKEYIKGWIKRSNSFRV